MKIQARIRVEDDLNSLPGLTRALQDVQKTLCTEDDKEFFGTLWMPYSASFRKVYKNLKECLKSKSTIN